MLAEFKSGREMARYFQIDGRVARAAIAKAFLLHVQYVRPAKQEGVY